MKMNDERQIKGYLYEKVSQAIGHLLWPADDADAGHAFLTLLRIRPEHEEQVTQRDSLYWWHKVKPFLDLGERTAFEHAAALTPEQKAAFSNALWQLRSGLEHRD
jgi:hypothetical protein